MTLYTKLYRHFLSFPLLFLSFSYPVPLLFLSFSIVVLSFFLSFFYPFLILSYPFPILLFLSLSYPFPILFLILFLSFSYNHWYTIIYIYAKLIQKSTKSHKCILDQGSSCGPMVAWHALGYAFGYTSGIHLGILLGTRLGPNVDFIYFWYAFVYI